jgi:hypothetical protein
LGIGTATLDAGGAGRDALFDLGKAFLRGLRRVQFEE